MKAGIKFQKHGSYLIGTKYMLALLPADVMNQQLLRTIFQLSARLSWDFLWPLQYKAEYRTRDITGFRQNFWEKAHDFRWSSWKILIFFRVKSWALHSSSNLIGNTNVCNSTETWRSMQLRNTIDEYTNFKQSSETKLLQWRKRTILIRQFKYCFSNF